MGIDPKQIFSLFEADDEAVYKQHGLQDVLKEHTTLLGMVVRGVENYFLMDQIQMNKWGDEYNQVRSKVRHKYLVKLLSYLQRIDRRELTSLEKPAFRIGYKETLQALDNMIKYFESIEQYERCAEIKRYLDLVLEPDPVKQLETVKEDYIDLDRLFD